MIIRLIKKAGTLLTYKEIADSLLIVCLLVAAALILAGKGQVSFSVFLLGLAIGYVLQRSRFCVASAYSDLLLFQSATLFRALIISLIVSTLGFSLLQFRGAVGFVAVAGWRTVLGGLLFGCGMLLAGGCAAGTLMRLGEGYVLFIPAFIGLFIGSKLGISHAGFWDRLSGSDRVFFLPDLLGWLPALLLTVITLSFLWWIARENK